MIAFLAMGGYAAFVWPAYGISLACLATMVAVTVRDYRRAKAQLAHATKQK
jgi:heme exporter protein D